MTAQATDIVLYEGREYRLLDVSDNKVLSCRECVGGAYGGEYCTACWRGSLAEYEVEDGILVLRRDSDDLTLRDLPRPLAERLAGKRRTEAPAKPGTVIPLTGFIVICRGGWHMDFFERIFDTDEALELEFDEGMLVGVTDLGDFVRAGRTHIDSMPKGEDGRLSDLDFLNDYGHMMAVMATLTPVLPRGRYTGITYVWRSNRPETKCVLCSSLGKAS